MYKLQLEGKLTFLERKNDKTLKMELTKILFLKDMCFGVYSTCCLVEQIK